MSKKKKKVNMSSNKISCPDCGEPMLTVCTWCLEHSWKNYGQDVNRNQALYDMRGIGDEGYSFAPNVKRTSRY